MKYVKILFAIALVFTMCSAFSLKKDNAWLYKKESSPLQ